MPLNRELEKNPYAAPVGEDAPQLEQEYREIFDDDDALQEAVEMWPRCRKCGKRRVTRCPICKTSGNLFPLADQEYFNPAAETFAPPPLPKSGCGCGCRANSRNCGDDGCSHDASTLENVIDIETEESHAERAQARRAAWTLLLQKLENPSAVTEEPTPPLLCHVCSEAFTPVFPRFCEWCNHDFGFGEVYDGEISPEVEEFLQRKASQEDAAFEADPSRMTWTILALVGVLALFLGYWYFVL